MVRGPARSYIVSWFGTENEEPVEDQLTAKLVIYGILFSIFFLVKGKNIC